MSTKRPRTLARIASRSKAPAIGRTPALSAETQKWFWSNHFCVSADKAGVRPIAGAFEREAIRANVLGRFVDMLRAVETHPAMLLYLDNARSIGPNSQAGRN